jgi:lipoate-protein ligase A
MYDLALRAAGRDPEQNLALEESLLEKGFPGRRLFLVYVDDPCVVIGRNQNPWVEVSAGAGLPALRRVSGGGAVYHDKGNLNWSLILRRSDHDREAELSSVAAALRSLGVEAETGPRGGLFYAGEGPWKGAKLSGTARRLQAERVLHHGTLLVDADLAKLEASLRGLEAESSKALPSARSRSVNLSALAPGLTVDDAAAALARALSSPPFEEAESVADAAYASESRRRLASWEWTWGATPAFSLALPWSGGRAELVIREGRVASAEGPGAEALAGLCGERFDYGIRLAAIEALEGASVATTRGE